uniref:protein-tyrosine-phosphatase n=1 Tax=Pyxicephalus adspersus TaxID=30357 RepID=A0AAV2ZH71_PYXAD|nr:TPA: hypothetical protein GDO54_004263 [Pyxicephalus adspersus]
MNSDRFLFSVVTDTTEPPDGDTSSLLTSVLVPLLVCFALIILAGYLLRSRKSRKADVSSGDKKIGILEEQEQQRVLLISNSPTVNKTYFPIPVEKLEEEVRIRSADDGKLFREEYNSLQMGNPQGSFDVANRDENREKNRYPNILPYDHSRLVLTPIEGCVCSDYINASYIDGYKEKNKFIAAQGPKQDTVNDFWRMVWEQKSATIVMLTNLKERKEDKCYQYWPDQGCWIYGNIRVSVEDVIVLVDYTIRKFCIQPVHDGCKAPRLVTQLHFTSWPDFGVPFTPIGMLKFLKKVKSVNPAHAGPIVVHCSAGVGRTGTFIVIDAIIDMMNEEKKVDVFHFVLKIRSQRPQMVQTDMQYSFIYQALLEYYLYGDTELDVASLEKHLQNLYSPAPHFEKTGLEQEFKVGLGFAFLLQHINLSINLQNMLSLLTIKTFLILYYIDDFNRVILPMKRGEEYTDYINASFIDEKQSRLVRQFHFHGWPEIGIPAEGKGMIDLIAAVQKQQQQTGNHPIIVHCSAGAGRTGTFIALSNILERVKAEGLLDVFQTVKSLRMQRPHMVQTLEQYEFCYKVVQDFIDIFSDYANFK